MRRKFKLLFLTLSFIVLGFASFITIYGAQPIADLIDVQLEQQESLVNDKIRYGHNVPISYTDDYGHYALVTPEDFGGTTILCFIVKNSNWEKDYESDRSVNLTHLVPDSDGYYNIYLKTGSGTIYTNPEQTEIYS